MTAPILRIAVGEGALGCDAAIAIVCPSTDDSGRLYPFLIAADGLAGADAVGLGNSNDNWFGFSEELLLSILSPRFSLPNLTTSIGALPFPKSDNRQALRPAAIWTASFKRSAQTHTTLPALDQFFITEVQ